MNSIDWSFVLGVIGMTIMHTFWLFYLPLTPDQKGKKLDIFSGSDHESDLKHNSSGLSC